MIIERARQLALRSPARVVFPDALDIRVLKAQQMREFVANGGSLIGLVQKHCEIWTA